MGSSFRADRFRPHGQPPRPPTPPAAWDEKPTMLIPTPQVAPPARPRFMPPQLSAPTIPRRQFTLRQRLVGQTSMVVISLMLLRLIWLVIHGLWDGKDVRFAVVGAGIYVMACCAALGFFDFFAGAQAYTARFSGFDRLPLQFHWPVALTPEVIAST